MSTSMKKQQVNDQMALISQYYPDIYTQLMPDQEQGEAKPRRRRKKNKGSESSGSGSGGMMRKRKLSDEQVHLLEMNFGSEHKLESERKDRLASELGLDPRQVAVWFQNRRARWKNKKLEEEYAKLKAQHDNNVVEKCRLETEVLKLKEQLSEAEREMHRVMERTEGISISNSPSSSFSMEAMEPLFLGEFGMEGLETVFNSNFTNHGLEWPVNQQYGINGM